MQYISTRGLESSFSFSDILFEGYAEDGGLYVRCSRRSTPTP